MRLTVLICTYNRADSLRVVLDGLFQQEVPDDLVGDWEILVVDNNSTDATPRVVEEFARRGSPLVRYLLEPRQGKSNALNSGIPASRGAVLAFTDDDVLVGRHWVACVAEAVRLYPGYRAFGGKVVPQWPEHVPAWIQRKGPYARPIVGGVIVSHNRGDEIQDYRRGKWPPIGANMFFRREVFDDYGTFRVDLGPTGERRLWVNEDCEFGFRLMRRGEKILYYPRAFITHPVAEEKFSKRYLRAYFRDAGNKQALEHSAEPLIERLKLMVRSGVRLARHGILYAWHRMRGNAAAAMHHECRLCYFGARAWQLARMSF